jgi:hypothetical protein
LKLVIASEVNQAIIAALPQQPVMTEAAIDAVIAKATANQMIAIQAEDHIVAAEAADHVRARSAPKFVVIWRTGDGDGITGAHYGRRPFVVDDSDHGGVGDAERRAAVGIAQGQIHGLVILDISIVDDGHAERLGCRIGVGEDKAAILNA